ncbi:transposase [Streptomyces sp. CA-135486]|uniref:transposase n=1 Tax=Streptomyces sp. CA-135486 TaxID=3240049 RepID=UPI003D945573
MLGECKPNRNGANFLAFMEKAVTPHAGKEIHVVLDNLSTHPTPDVKAWLAKNPHVHFHFTPVESSWLNQIEIWFGIITRRSIRRGTFARVNVLVKQIGDYILERERETLHLDRHRRRDPRQGPTRPDRGEETRQ